MAEEKLQRFQSRAGVPLASLEVIEDKYGDPVIYWDEIQRNFENVFRLFKGAASVSFVRDKETMG
ncbi:hypothetical protein BG000_003599, partial [Podila horticola]